MTTETFRRADHRPVPTSAHEVFSLGHNSFSFSQKAVQRNRGAREERTPGHIHRQMTS